MRSELNKNLGFAKNGSALLTAMLVMGVLISISLALSSLILREIRMTKNVLDAGRAYYAAESGIEISLYNIKNNLPGWETTDKNYKPLKIDDEYVAVGEYKVDNTCSAYPCFDPESGYDTSSINNENLKAYYDVLDLNESITIPLFVVKDENGQKVEQSVSGFTVEFFAPFNPKEDLDFGGNPNLLAGWDILRWKIYGISTFGGGKQTESIGDFTALSMQNFADVNKQPDPTNAANPSWFGTKACNDGSPRYTGDINCSDYIFSNLEKIKINGQDVYAGTCLSTQAREYYDYGGNNDVDSINGCYDIGTFLTTHRLNYLTLTNMMNPAVFNSGFDDQQKKYLSRLFFRVELFGDEGRNKTVREYADITSNGYSGDSKQSINVKIKRDSFMPVFNFSLYSTY